MSSEAAALLTSEQPSVRVLKLNGHVGFDSFPEQLINKGGEKSFDFNVMCVGETGLGKSTLMESLFNTKFESTDGSHTLPNVKLMAHTYELQENSVLLKLTICETVGFGDQINKRDSFRVIMDYIDVQFERYLQEELQLQRSLFAFHDSRIHACLYFISPTGHGLKSLDLACMKQLDSKVNIIPIIAKADTLSKADLILFKKKIMAELTRSEIKIYYFPTDDEAVAERNTAMNDHIPFAVVGSTEFVRIGNRRVRARQYPWGVVQVENEAHCDFMKLREMFILTNMEDLREKTHVKHYELYRQKRLKEMGCCDVDKNNKPVSLQQTLEVKYTRHRSLLLAKEEQMRQQFVHRVTSKGAELKEFESNLQLRFAKLKKDHDEEQTRLDEARTKLESDILEFLFLKYIYLYHYTASGNFMTLGKNCKK